MSGRYTMSGRCTTNARAALRASLLSATVVLLSTVLLAGCGDTLQDQPIGPAPFETVILKSHFPVYWLGARFGHLRATGVSIDPGGSVTIAYGDCLVGGQYTCVTPLSLVTSPDNSFLPGGGAASMPLRIRGVQASSLQNGTTLVIATGSVVVSVYGHNAALARAAAQAMTPLNQAEALGASLPKPLPDTGFGRTPLPSQLPAGA